MSKFALITAVWGEHVRNKQIPSRKMRRNSLFQSRVWHLLGFFCLAIDWNCTEMTRSSISAFCERSSRPMTQHFLWASSFPCIAFCITWSCTRCISFLVSVFGYWDHITTPIYRATSFSWHRAGKTALVCTSFASIRCAITITSLFNFSLSRLRAAMSHSIYSKLIFVIPIKTSISFSERSRASWHDIWDVWNGFYFSSRYWFLTGTPLLLFTRLKIVGPSTV